MSHQVPVDGKAARGDGGRSHGRAVDDIARGLQAGDVAQQGFENGGEVMAEDGRLRRLPMGIGDNESVALPLRHRSQGLGQPHHAFQQGIDSMLESELEQGVVDVVARTRRVKTAREIGTQALAQFLLDQEEEILHLAGIGQCADIELAVDGFQSLGDGPRLLDGQDARLMQHHQMSPVDQPEPFDMVILGPVEKRTKHCLLVDRIGKDGRVVERACSHRL